MSSRAPGNHEKRRALPEAARARSARGGAPGPARDRNSLANDPRRRENNRRARSCGGERRRGHRSRRRRERSWARRRRAAAAADEDSPGDAGSRRDPSHRPGDVVLGDPTLKRVAGDPEEGRGTDDGAALVESFDAERPLDRLEIERFNGEAHAKDTKRGPVSRSDHVAPPGHPRPPMICSRTPGEKSRSPVNISDPPAKAARGLEPGNQAEARRALVPVAPTLTPSGRAEGPREMSALR